MKRLLSWVVAGLGMTISSYAIELACRLVAIGLEAIGGLGQTAFVLVLVLGGGTILGIMGTILFLGSSCVVFLSQACYKTKKGTRYVLLGGFYLAWYVFVFVMMLAGVVRAASPFAGYATSACMVCYSLLVIFLGKGKALDDGPPPSRRERLQRKLDKEIEKESRKKALAALEQMEREGINIQDLIRANRQAPSVTAEQTRQRPQEARGVEGSPKPESAPRDYLSPPEAEIELRIKAGVPENMLRVRGRPEVLVFLVGDDGLYHKPGCSSDFGRPISVADVGARVPCPKCKPPICPQWLIDYKRMRKEADANGYNT